MPFFGKSAVGLASVLLLGAWTAAQETKSEEAPVPMSLAHAEKPGSKDCIDCHTHNKSTTDSHHSDVGGYSYNSQACYSCHPRGAAGD